MSALSFYLFIAHSLTSHRPFLDLRLLLNRNYSLGLALIAIFGMLNFTPMVLLPPLMRVYMGFPDVLVGQVVGARGLGGMLGFFAVIFLSRLDPRVSVGIGFALQLVAGIWLMRIDLNVTPFELGLNGAVQGLSSGVIVVALTLVTFSNIPRERMPEATAVYHLLRNIGASMFISICVAEVVRSTGVNYSVLSELDLAVQPHAGIAVGGRTARYLEPGVARAPLGRDLPAGRHDRASQRVRPLHRRRCGVGAAGIAVAERA